MQSGVRLGVVKLVLVALGVPVVALAVPVQLRTNALMDPIGIDSQRPAFSWRSEAKTADWVQSGYEVLVATSADGLAKGKADVWDSGRVKSSDSVNILYGGGALKAQQRYVWKVLVWDGKGSQAASEAASFETGLLGAADWKAEWITRKDAAAEQERAAIRYLWVGGEDALHVPSEERAVFGYTLKLEQKPAAASLHVMARGGYTARVNGHVTGHHEDWSAFDREEIAPWLHAGDNEVRIEVTAPKVDAPGKDGPAALAASIRVTHADGREERIVSDASWKAGRSSAALMQPAEVVGGLAMKFGVGVDRREALPGPERIDTDASVFRKDFSVGKKVQTARLTVTALGAYAAYLNGKPVAPGTLLAPGWTDFRKRVQYQTYDVTALVKSGQNALGVMLGGGWYSSPLTWVGFRVTPGPNLLRAQLEVTLADGTRQTVATDGSWSADAAPVTFSEIYAGESYDARLMQKGWSEAGFDAAKWASAARADGPKDVLVTAQPDLPIALEETRKPVHLEAANGVHPAIFDMGQNMVGNVRLKVEGARGTVVKLRYAERLNPDGSLYTENLRNADATDTYALAGGGAETWTPAFTFHGFRYVEMSFVGDAAAGSANLDSIEGLVYNSLPAKPSVRLTSSSETLNKMNELGAWGQRGNFFSIPTDCPQRDERLGWMGDAGAFWRTGTFNFDIDAFTHKFMLDVEDAQTDAGAFTDISPNLLGSGPGAPGWGDAGVFIPYAAWLQYGDVAAVKQAWPAMERWMKFIEATNPDYLRRKELGNNYADWLAPDQNTPKDLIATAYWALIAREMTEMAKAIGRTEDAAKYQQTYDRVAGAYRAEYVKVDGSVAGNTQTAYLATVFTGIAPEGSRKQMVDRLVKDLAAHGDHLTTGFLGTPFLLPVLEQNGRTDLAFKLLLSETYPSWGYMVTHGATTWWERWNGDTGDPAMNSYNHYAFGSVMAWVYRRAAGIDTDAAGAGFHHLTIAPHFDASLPKLHVEYDSAYGTVISDWVAGRFTVTLPPNTSATVELPGEARQEVGSGVHPFTVR